MTDKAAHCLLESGVKLAILMKIFRDFSGVLLSTYFLNVYQALLS